MQESRDSPQDYHWTVMEVLTSYLREKTFSKQQNSQSFVREVISPQNNSKKLIKPSTDIQAILDVIARRTQKQRQLEEEKQRLDLSGVDIRGANLCNAQLEKILLIGANLAEADFGYCFAENANFGSACLKQTNFSNANLKAAKFTDSDLEKTDFNRANLEGANFYQADIKDINVTGAYLKGVR